MKHILIITEDIVKIQSLSGRFARVYRFIYLKLLLIKIKLTVFCFRKNKLTLVASDYFSFSGVDLVHYSQEITTQNYALANPMAWKFINSIAKKLNQLQPLFLCQAGIPLIKVWELKLAYTATYSYLAYFNYFGKLFGREKPDKVIVIGTSQQAKMAVFQAKQNRINCRQIKLFDLSWLTRRLNHYFRKREYLTMLEQFLSQQKQPFKQIKSMPKTVILSADFFRHLKTLLPQYLYLKQKKYNPWIITNINAIQNYLHYCNLPDVNFNFIAGFLPPDYYRQHRCRWQRQISRLLPEFIKIYQSPRQNTEQFLEALIAAEFLPLIRYGLSLTKLYLEAASRLVLTVKPKALIVAADTRIIERSLVLLAKKHHLASILTSTRTIIFDEEPNRFHTVERVSVTGPQAYSQVLKYKNPAQQIRICGDPRYEFLEQTIRYSKAKLYQQLGIMDLNKKIILLISDRSNTLLPPEEKRQSFLLVNEAVKALDKAVLVIKPHPTEKRFRLLEELSDWGMHDAIVSDNNQIELFNLLKASSVVILAWSMTGLEAILFKRPVIVVNPTGKDYDRIIPYVRGQGAILARDKDELTKYLTILSDHNNPFTKQQLQNAEKFVQNYVQLPDGQVCRRITEFLFNFS